MATSILRISLLVTLVMVAFTGLLLVPVACVAPWWADILGVGAAIAALVLASRLYGRWVGGDPALGFYDRFISKDSEL